MAKRTRMAPAKPKKHTSNTHVWTTAPANRQEQQGFEKYATSSSSSTSPPQQYQPQYPPVQSRTPATIDLGSAYLYYHRVPTTLAQETGNDGHYPDLSEEASWIDIDRSTGWNQTTAAIQIQQVQHIQQPQQQQQQAGVIYALTADSLAMGDGGVSSPLDRWANEGLRDTSWNGVGSVRLGYYHLITCFPAVETEQSRASGAAGRGGRGQRTIRPG